MCNRLRNFFGVTVAAMCIFLTGCSSFSSRNSSSNVAYNIPREIASNGATPSIKAKPMQSADVVEVDDAVLLETHAKDDLSAFSDPTTKNCQTYVVQSGDTLSSIARKFNVRVASIMADNSGLTNVNQLRVGQRLKICTDHKKPVMVREVGENLVAREYIVEPGDYLQKVAKMHGVEVGDIKAANKLQSDRIIVGQKLIIPASKPKIEKVTAVDTSDRYVVRAGDSLSTIARHLGVTQAALAKANNISNPNSIRVGQKLIVPVHNNAVSRPIANDSKVAQSAKPEPAVASPATSSLGVDMYLIRSGDTIEHIANTLGVDQSELMSWNGINKDTVLKPGQKLLVPARRVDNAAPAVAPKTSKPSEDFFDNFDEIPVIEIAE